MLQPKLNLSWEKTTYVHLLSTRFELARGNYPDCMHCSGLDHDFWRKEMHEPSDREIQLEILKTLKSIEHKIYWLVGIVAALFLVAMFG